MAGKNTAAFGIYSSRPGVENAVDTLKKEGFRNTDISVLFPYNEGSKDFAHEKSTKAPEGAATGAGTGAVVGGTLGWLAGIRGVGYSGPGTLHRCRSHHHRAGGRGCGWGCRRIDRSLGRYGHS